MDTRKNKTIHRSIEIGPNLENEEKKRRGTVQSRGETTAKWPEHIFIKPRRGESQEIFEEIMRKQISKFNDWQQPQIQERQKNQGRG